MANMPLSYKPETLTREMQPYYIGASDADIQAMLKTLGLTTLEELYSHIASDHKFKGPLNMPRAMGYEELITHVNQLAKKNNPRPSFISDGLPNYKALSIVGDICGIRGLTTAYTPYQPERSQGTLQTLWIYQSLISQLTGFEGVNASLYDRSTCLYEALLCAQRLVKGSTTALVSDALYPGDLEVLETQAKETGLTIRRVPLDPETGRTSLTQLKSILSTSTGICGLAFAQINTLGNLEDVDALTDLCRENGIKSIAVIDPMLLGPKSLKPPVAYGKEGADMLVAEGQHLAIAPNFGGPGLGIFAIRYNEKDKNSIRSTAGRYVGKAVDSKGRECKALILSTREQHIRREKATSNICSNQSFIASLAGACMLARGDEGFKASAHSGMSGIRQIVKEITKCKGVTVKFPQTPVWNEVTIKLPLPCAVVMAEARAMGIHIGVDVSSRFQALENENLLLVAVTDTQSSDDIQKFISFFHQKFGATESSQELMAIPSILLRTDSPDIPKLPEADIIQYYKRLGAQNLSPDDGIYPLGSCTMKYNPHINDYAASLAGFTDVHPEAPLADIQGSLEVLFEIQEMFKAITGLPAVTTQPVAGAQGELVGLKMFQAYHRSRGEGDQRRTLIIPRSAHGTNPASATVAGYEIKLIEALPNGEMNLEQVREILKTEGSSIAGVMVTNPNTAGIFETGFAEMAKLVHEAGGLVYMDGANMNAVAGIVDLNAIGVDAVHNNLHKTWTIPHGGGGPGDAIVAVSHRLKDFMPGIQVEKKADGSFGIHKPSKSCGSFHRHFGNFAHKVRAYIYIKALGAEGVRKMSSVAVLSARYLYHNLSSDYPTLPAGSTSSPRMHEFILTLAPETFTHIEKVGGVPKANSIARIGKLFLDFGFHAPTVAFPEQYGLMVEPTETYNKAELDQFSGVVKQILSLVKSNPEVLQTVPHFTPIDRVDEVTANKNPQLSEKNTKDLPPILPDRVNVDRLRKSTPGDLCEMIIEAHKKEKA
ncbi:MAG: aminomethyl-transferring glycine dehydrogenase subunit GcvPB [Bacteriovoracaceae bacterium]|nr:aminomethyl-transferring glycine dehydrogenase subunit GcvPB [Bacteriovoracaceae bacterium]